MGKGKEIIIGKGKWQRILAVLTAFALIAVSVSLPYPQGIVALAAGETAAEAVTVGPFSIAQTDGSDVESTDYTWDAESNVLTINTEAALTISMAENATEPVTARIAAKGTTTEGSTDTTYNALNLTLAGVNITAPENHTALSTSGSLTITLAEGTTNTLTGGSSSSYGIYAQGALSISGGGSLHAVGGNVTATGSTSAGIFSGTSIIIDGGTVEAIGGSSSGTSFGIYARNGSGNATITIKSGNVTATGGQATNDSCGMSANSSITIENGTVTATGGTATNSYGLRASSSNISITSGNVTATGNKAGIQGAFSTGDNGNAIIHASSISDQSGKTNNTWKGIIFEGNTGKVYGEQTLEENFEIKSGEVLTIPSGAGLTIPSGKTLTNNGTLTVEDGGRLTNNGSISGTGTLEPKLETIISGSSKETSYVQSYDITQLFTIPSTAGEATYSLESGGTGTGSMDADGRTLNITKAGTFLIKVQTEETQFYSAGEQTATLTVTTIDQSAPATPSIASHTKDSITLTAVEANANGAVAEYSKDGGVTWQTSPTFTGLTGDTEYTFVVRYAAVDGKYNPSSASAELTSKIPHSFTNYVADENATCTADGTETAKCDSEECDVTDTRTDEGSALGHDWDTATYKWSADGKTCTARRICKNDGSHIETEAAVISSKETKKATYFVMGETTYTASFVAEWASEQTKTVADIPCLTDETVPTGEIKVGTNRWNQFLNTITFGLFFKETQSVTITASDDSYAAAGYTNDKAVKVEYYLYSGETALTTEELDALEDGKFVSYDKDFSINPNNKYVVYVRLTDHANNVTYINSQGIVLDAEAPVVGGITNNATYCGAVEVTVSDEYMGGVTVNGVAVTVTDGKFTVAPKTGAQTIIVTDKAGNKTTFIITVNDGHTPNADDGNCTTAITCSICDAVTTAAKAHDFNGDWKQDKDGHWHMCQNPDCTVAESKTGHTCTPEVTKEATCTEEGVRTYTCECGYSYTEVIAIDSNNHDLVHHEAQAPTTEAVGWEAYDTCSREGCDYTTYVELPMLPKKDEPFIKGDDGKTGWDVITDKTENALPGDKIVVDMNGTTTVPGDVIESIKGKDVTLELDMGDGIIWTIDGESVTKEDIGDINLNITKDTQNIPLDVINNVTGERYSMNLSLEHEGEFGFTAVLTIDMEKKNAGLYANLFYYNETDRALEFICADEIDGEGFADLAFTHASDYTIVIDTKVMDGSDEPTEPEAPSKGDNTSPMGLLILTMLSALGVAVLVVRRRRA